MTKEEIVKKREELQNKFRELDSQKNITITQQVEIQGQLKLLDEIEKGL